jgi:hypothetical protein
MKMKLTGGAPTSGFVASGKNKAHERTLSMKKSSIFRTVSACLVFLTLFACVETNQKADFPVLSGPYLGQKPPGMMAEIFAPGIISTDAREVMYGFFSSRKGGFGKSDLYCSVLHHGEYQEVENLGKVINSKLNDHDPFIAPDGGYLLWCSDRPAGYGGNDLYIAYKQDNGQWAGPFNLGENINTSANETRPYVTSNGKYLFFASDANSGLDIFWVDAKIIEDMKPDNIR